MVDRLQGKKVVGVKQATKEIKNGRGHTLYLAKDADKRVIDPLIELSEESGVLVVFVETMTKLGKLAGIDVKAAAALILKD